MRGRNPKTHSRSSSAADFSVEAFTAVSADRSTASSSVSRRLKKITKAFSKKHHHSKKRSETNTTLTTKNKKTISTSGLPPIAPQKKQQQQQLLQSQTQQLEADNVLQPTPTPTPHAAKKDVPILPTTEANTDAEEDSTETASVSKAKSSVMKANEEQEEEKPSLVLETHYYEQVVLSADTEDDIPLNTIGMEQGNVAPSDISPKEAGAENQDNDEEMVIPEPESSPKKQTERRVQIRTKHEGILETFARFGRLCMPEMTVPMTLTMQTCGGCSCLEDQIGDKPFPTDLSVMTETEEDTEEDHQDQPQQKEDPECMVKVYNSRSVNNNEEEEEKTKGDNAKEQEAKLVEETKQPQAQLVEVEEENLIAEESDRHDAVEQVQPAEEEPDTSMKEEVPAETMESAPKNIEEQAKEPEEQRDAAPIVVEPEENAKEESNHNNVISSGNGNGPLSPKIYFMTKEERRARRVAEKIEMERLRRKRRHARNMQKPRGKDDIEKARLQQVLSDLSDSSYADAEVPSVVAKPQTVATVAAPTARETLEATLKKAMERIDHTLSLAQKSVTASE